MKKNLSILMIKVMKTLLMLNNNHVEYIEKIFKKLYFASVNGIYFHTVKKRCFINLTHNMTKVLQNRFHIHILCFIGFQNDFLNFFEIKNMTITIIMIFIHQMEKCTFLMICILSILFRIECKSFDLQF